MPRFSTRAAMVAALEHLHVSTMLTQGLAAGINAGLIAALPVSPRPADSADLDRGLWSRDADGRPIWVRVNA